MHYQKNVSSMQICIVILEIEHRSTLLSKRTKNTVTLNTLSLQIARVSYG